MTTTHRSTQWLRFLSKLLWYRLPSNHLCIYHTRALIMIIRCAPDHRAPVGCAPDHWAPVGCAPNNPVRAHVGCAPDHPVRAPVGAHLPHTLSNVYTRWRRSIKRLIRVQACSLDDVIDCLNHLFQPAYEHSLLIVHSFIPESFIWLQLITELQNN